ncbi:uncharacterized protein BYT42DRAFT_52950 [Radiomyces spectabilis]|uniref:uncharacterized protein n=1 Tax=Radiomyces spectabilis TaxID=64574 RepID=UPI00221FEF2A|nr:uncharacterized protein BYT42DRAFT_52950 [Radiomyces spectabilis]KAI8372950.1 hypothetical protein BYT42DRAFT_52950 [Radiomyces spectabilis]
MTRHQHSFLFNTMFPLKSSKGSSFLSKFKSTTRVGVCNETDNDSNGSLKMMVEEQDLLCSYSRPSPDRIRSYFPTHPLIQYSADTYSEEPTRLLLVTLQKLKTMECPTVERYLAYQSLLAHLQHHMRKTDLVWRAQSLCEKRNPLLLGNIGTTKPRRTRYIALLLETAVDHIQPGRHPVHEALRRQRKLFSETAMTIGAASCTESMVEKEELFGWMKRRQKKGETTAWMPICTVSPSPSVTTLPPPSSHAAIVSAFPSYSRKPDRPLLHVTPPRQAHRVVRAPASGTLLKWRARHEEDNVPLSMLQTCISMSLSRSQSLVAGTKRRNKRSRSLRESSKIQKDA